MGERKHSARANEIKRLARERNALESTRVREKLVSLSFYTIGLKAFVVVGRLMGLGEGAGKYCEDDVKNVCGGGYDGAEEGGDRRALCLLAWKYF